MMSLLSRCLVPSSFQEVSVSGPMFLLGEGVLYDVTSVSLPGPMFFPEDLCLWSHVPSGGLCLWSHVPSRGGLCFWSFRGSLSRSGASMDRDSDPQTESPWTETIPGQRPPWIETPCMVKSGWNAFLF